MEQIGVLIVDDSPTARDGLQSILRPHPDLEAVGVAVNGFDAIAFDEQLQPSVILMDAQMPVIDGVETTRRIKDRFPRIKVLLLAVHEKYADAALAAGADGYLIKDSSRQELIQAIRQLGRSA